MSPVASPIRARPDARPHAMLRLLPQVAPELRCERQVRSEPLRTRETARPALRVLAAPNRVLVAGADARRRATLRAELAQTMPASTVFDEAHAVCEVLGRAPTSRMAVLAGDLDDAPAATVMQMLAHRHPELPVLVVGSSD